MPSELGKEDKINRILTRLRDKGPIAILIVLSLCTGLFAAVLYANTYKNGVEGLVDLGQGLTAELSGVAYELFVVGVVLTYFEKRREKRSKDIEEKRAEHQRKVTLETSLRKDVTDGVAMESRAGQVKVWRATYELNDLDIYNIRLDFARLSDEKKLSLEGKRKITICNTRMFRAELKDRNLSDSKFRNLTMSECDFSGSTLLRVEFDESKIQDTLFKGAGLQLASFNEVVFSGKIDFEGAALTTCTFKKASGMDINFHNCEVREDFKERVSTWEIDSETFFKGHILYFRHVPFRHHPDGSVKDFRKVWKIAKWSRYRDERDFFLQTKAEDIIDLEDA